MQNWKIRGSRALTLVYLLTFVSNFRELCSVFVESLCHQLVPPGTTPSTNHSAAASNQALGLTDGLWHDVWLLLSSHRPPTLRLLCLAKWPPLPVRRCASLESWHAARVQTQSIEGTGWMMGVIVCGTEIRFSGGLLFQTCCWSATATNSFERYIKYWGIIIKKKNAKRNA